jgi:TPR repeat protein
MYRVGEGCEVDKQKAYELFKKSADRGDITAQSALGMFFFFFEIGPIITLYI